MDGLRSAEEGEMAAEVGGGGVRGGAANSERCSVQAITIDAYGNRATNAPAAAAGEARAEPGGVSKKRRRTKVDGRGTSGARVRD